MLKKYFVNQAIKEVAIEEFIKSNFPTTDYSKIELQRTPLGIKIVIYTDKPGRVIGRGGGKINEINEALKTRFKLENPQLDVKSIENPDLDPRVVAKQIKLALERGFNYKKIGNLTLKRMMDAGAIGAEIIISGKLGGSKGKTAKFIAGYLAHCGMPSEELVDHTYEQAYTKPGMIGIKVKIMREFMTITGERLEKVEEKPIIKEEFIEEVEKVEKKKVEKEPKKPKKVKKKKGAKSKKKIRKSLKIKRIKSK